MLIHTLCISVQYVRSLLSLLLSSPVVACNGFQRRSFLSFRVHVLTGRRLSHNSLIAPKLAAISHQPPTLLTAVSRLPCNSIWSSLYSIGADRTEDTAFKLMHSCVLHSRYLTMALQSSCFEQTRHITFLQGSTLH
jgi:hypothetical protein